MMVGVLLAAGASTRMGSPKALVKEKGLSLLAHGVRHLWTACDAVVVVLGWNGALVRRRVEEEFQGLVGSGKLNQDLTTAHRHGSKGLEVTFVANRGWRSGMLSSVRIGLSEAIGLKPEAVVVLPVDCPSVKPATVHDLASLMRMALKASRTPRERREFAYALVPRFRKDRGHPIALSPALARAVAVDRGARDLSDAVRRNARLLGYFDVSDPGVVRNRNRPGD
ncbi:MAG: hypothetical protein E6K73_12000 [Candidatus Eisenbacteria bacterium]|uniref:MobA-like NTP transferase domain-containing protein n=1 Tax=Eiseniibacteriota bacterium TaxID=2212470 RepID=A0A538SAT4_UNCEI|nr:MAG: hypothetical protein E6K73_12000 [Candidatus Eisenbacteria bacterium]